MTVVMTGGLIAVCMIVRRHYDLVHKAIEQLEADVLPEIFAAVGKRTGRSATLMRRPQFFWSMALTAWASRRLTTIQRLFNEQFRNVVFISVGEVDSALMKGPEEVRHLEQEVADDLVEYCRFAADLGFHPELRTGIGPDVVVELHRLCLEVASEYPARGLLRGQAHLYRRTRRLRQSFPAQSYGSRVQNWLQVHGLAW